MLSNVGKGEYYPQQKIEAFMVFCRKSDIENQVIIYGLNPFSLSAVDWLENPLQSKKI